MTQHLKIRKIAEEINEAITNPDLIVHYEMDRPEAIRRALAESARKIQSLLREKAWIPIKNQWCR